MDAEHLDVVAAVGDDRQLAADLLLHPRTELGASGASGQERDSHPAYPQ